MPIAVICPGCGDAYNLGDDLAGRRCRCKGCGTVFRVPEASPAASARGGSSGLDGGPDLPPPPRGPKPVRTTRRRPGASDDGADPLYVWGYGLTCLGTLIVILPGSGLQLAVVGFLPQRTQSIVAGLAWLIGCLLLTASTPKTTWQRLVKAAGIAWLVFLAVLIGIAIWRIANGQNHPQPADAPPFGGPPGPPGDVGDESMFTLSNAQAARAAGPLGNLPGIGIDFRVDYRGSGRMPPGLTVWIVESPRTKARDNMPRLQPGGGTLVGTLMFDRGDTGPFKTYLAHASQGPGGESLVKISNTIDMAWRGDQGIGDVPSGFPTAGPPMPMPMPGPTPGGPMPGPMPPGFNGPRGPFGPRGPMPGPPPGFPRRPGRP